MNGCCAGLSVAGSGVSVFEIRPELVPRRCNIMNFKLKMGVVIMPTLSSLVAFRDNLRYHPSR